MSAQDLDGYVIVFAQTPDNKLKVLGCPAECEDVKHSDEIIEVNGRSVKNCPRDSLSHYIKQCLQSRSVSLRVKRRKTTEPKAHAIERVHDAFVIAVGDEAKERLVQFTSASTSTSLVHPAAYPHPLPHHHHHNDNHHHHHPHDSRRALESSEDMTKVFNKSLGGSSSNSSSADNITNTPTPTTTSNSNNNVSRKNKKGHRHHVEDEEEEEFITHQNPIYNSVAILTNQTEPRAAAMPGEKKKKTGSSKEDLSRDGEEWNEMDRLDHNGDRSKGKWKIKSIGTYSNSPVIQDYLSNGSASDGNNRYSAYSNGQVSNYSSNYDNAYDLDLDDSGPHREMAIDVPDNFVASVKSPPRFPPHLAGKRHSNTHNNNGSSSANSPSKSSSSPSSSHPHPHHHHHHHHHKDSGKGDITSRSQSSLNSTNSNNRHFQPTQEELQRLHYHQEELKKRREEENRLQAEENFLRESLRGSKKLQALEKSRKQAPPLPSGFVNTAFDDDLDGVDGAEDNDVDGSPEKRKGRRQRADLGDEDRYLKKNIVVDDVLGSLQHMRSKLNSPEDQKYLAFLKQMFTNEQFQNAVRQHNKVVEIASSSPPKRPDCEYAGELTSEICYHATQAHHNRPAEELLDLLTQPKMKNLLDAHDAVAQQTLQPSDNDLPPDPLDFPLMQYGEDSVKIIHLEKTNEHLGATVKNEGDSVIIARIVKGGVAEKSGQLHEGDEILEVNGKDMRGRNINEVSEMLADMSGTITFMIIPSHMSPANMPNASSVMDLRAMFSYDPEDDDYIPCKELGISFLRGDILHAIALDDPNWWQAFREGEDEVNLAGLIPSKAFTEQRERMKMEMENKENKRKGKACACGKKEKKKRRKRKSLYNGQTDDADDEVLTYEEIRKYYPQPNRKRPIVLIGPSNVGRQELQQRLLDSDPDRFGAPIPHTTRSMKPQEVEGSTYHFISKEEFQVMIAQTRFLEYGELQSKFYGTSVEAVRAVVAQGKVCLLKLQPQSLKVIRASDLKPYVVFVCPPNLEKLRLLQEQLDKANRQNDQDSSRTILSIDQMKEIIDCAREMEDQYGHLFDYVLVNSDLDRTYAELLDEINRIEMEPQWVPAAWVDSL